MYQTIVHNFCDLSLSRLYCELPVLTIERSALQESHGTSIQMPSNASRLASNRGFNDRILYPSHSAIACGASGEVLSRILTKHRKSSAGRR
jgi:hypothetical protein